MYRLQIYVGIHVHRFQTPIGRLHMYADMDGYTCTGTRRTLTGRTVFVQVPDTGRDTRVQVKTCSSTCGVAVVRSVS